MNIFWVEQDVFELRQVSPVILRDPYCFPVLFFAKNLLYLRPVVVIVYCTDTLAQQVGHWRLYILLF
jgi:hypothetical protein